jgi:hypothetical protein
MKMAASGDIAEVTAENAFNPSTDAKVATVIFGEPARTIGVGLLPLSLPDHKGLNPNSIGCCILEYGKGGRWG